MTYTPPCTHARLRHPFPALPLPPLRSDPEERRRLKSDVLSADCTFDVVVTTYDMAKSEDMQTTLLSRRWWQYVILDEVRATERGSERASASAERARAARARTQRERMARRIDLRGRTPGAARERASGRALRLPRLDLFRSAALCCESRARVRCCATDTSGRGWM